jgi:2-haloacid dehalogenase
MMQRRTVLASAGSALLTAGPAPLQKIRAIAFDGFTILDPRSINAVAEEAFPGKGVELSNAWRTRQFEYTWLRTLMRTYLDFRHVTEESLEFVAASLRLPLTTEKRERLTN